MSAVVSNSGEREHTMHFMVRFRFQQRCPQRLLRIAGEDVIRRLLNIVGRMRRHVSIFVHGHTHKRLDWLASAALNILLDVLIEVLLHDGLVATRMIVMFALTLSCLAINAFAGRTFLSERAVFEPAARRRNGGDPLAMLRTVGWTLSIRQRFAVEETTSVEKSPGVTRLPNRLATFKTPDESLNSGTQRTQWQLWCDLSLSQRRPR